MAQNVSSVVEKTKQDSRRELAFQRFYLKYREKIYWYLFRKIGRSEEAQDLTADVFLKLYEHIDEISTRGDSGVLSWLYTVSRNLSIDFLRKQGRRSESSLDTEDDSDEVQMVFDSFVDKMMVNSDVAFVYKAFHVLDDVEKEVIRLRFEEDLSFPVIAQMIGKSEGACKMILYRSIDKIRKVLVKE